MGRATRRSLPDQAPRTSNPRISIFRRLFPSAPIAALGLVMFVLALQVSVAGVFRTSRPDLALRLTPFDARARAELADRLASSASTSVQAPAMALAQDSIRRDPLQPEALRVLAQFAGGRRGEPRLNEASLMFQAERLSRRDHLTQVWLIRYFLDRGDIGSVMRHFDIALRSSVRARPTMFALLMETASIPALRRELETTLEAKSVWADEFAQYVVANSTDFDWAVRVAWKFFDPGSESDRPYFQTLLSRLTDAGRYELAWSVHQRLGSREAGRGGTGVTDGFELASGLAPFDWTFTQEPDLWAAPEKDERGRTIFRAAAYNGRSGEVARRLVQLPPGSYRIRVRMGDLPNELQERPELTVSCATNEASAPIARLRNEALDANGSLVEARFALPVGCSFQWIAVRISGLASSQDTDPWLGDLQITPLAR